MSTARRFPQLLFLLSAIPLVLAGCVSPLRHRVDLPSAVARSQWTVVSGITMADAGPEDCGAQVLDAVWEFTHSTMDGAPVLSGPSTPVDLLVAARKAGMKVGLRKGTVEKLAAEIDAGRPAMAMIDVRHEPPAFGFVKSAADKIVGREHRRQPHWMLVSGIAQDASNVLIAQPHDRISVMTREEFERRWEECGFCMIVLE